MVDLLVFSASYCGNGHGGVLLYNWLCGSLDHPGWTPNYWE